MARRWCRRPCRLWTAQASSARSGLWPDTLIQRFGSTLNPSVHQHAFTQPTLMSPLCGQIFMAHLWSHFARFSIVVSSHTLCPLTSDLFRKRTL